MATVLACSLFAKCLTAQLLWVVHFSFRLLNVAELRGFSLNVTSESMVTAAARNFAVGITCPNTTTTMGLAMNAEVGVNEDMDLQLDVQPMTASLYLDSDPDAMSSFWLPQEAFARPTETTATEFACNQQPVIFSAFRMPSLFSRRHISEGLGSIRSVVLSVRVDGGGRTEQVVQLMDLSLNPAMMRFMPFVSPQSCK